MIRKIDHHKFGHVDDAWHNSYFHFSFASYYDPNNMHLGPLRAVNDDVIAAHMGFDTHPHKNMEIITYVIEGEISHADSMGNGGTLKGGDVQAMAAGTGITHSEFNYTNEDLRVLQIWVKPNVKDIIPNYSEYRGVEGDRFNKWLKIVSPKDGDAPIQIHQDVSMYATITNEVTTFKAETGKLLYLIQVNGTSTINDITLNPSDALEATNGTLDIIPTGLCEFLIIEMQVGD